ncbi:MAG TPA: hypothetical protein DCM86_16285 [Verrucomicrobiales bacterium]|nr:hypothetical protein [Verrucomicrobiales bacterium]
MKTEKLQPAPVAASPAGAGRGPAVETSLMTTAVRGMQPLPGRREDRSGDPGQRSPAEAAALAAAGGAPVAGAAASEVSEAPIARPEGPIGIDALRETILNRTVEVRQEGLSSMSVVLRPDSSTELAVQIRSTDGGMEVHVRVERGDSSALQSGWPALQHTLFQHGIRLAGLDVAAHAATAMRLSGDSRGTPQAPVPGSAAESATGVLAAATAMNSSQGQEQRDPSGGRSPAAEAFLGDASTGQGRYGGSGRPGTDSSLAFSTGSESPSGPARGRQSASIPSRLPISNPPPGPTGTRGAGPWESWA